jgi:hypothetical protein
MLPANAAARCGLSMLYPPAAYRGKRAAQNVERQAEVCAMHAASRM